MQPFLTRPRDLTIAGTLVSARYMTTEHYYNEARWDDYVAQYPTGKYSEYMFKKSKYAYEQTKARRLEKEKAEKAKKG